jgi:hypothetical protein
MKRSARFLACSLVVLFAACGGSDPAAGTDDGWAARWRSLIPDPVTPGPSRPPRPGQVGEVPPLPEDRDLDFSFPDTLCGQLVRRLLECEIQRIQGQPNLRDNEKLSVISHKRRTFARKREKYLSHCLGKVAGLPEDGVKSCLRMPCVEMDRCLQKMSGQTHAK